MGCHGRKAPFSVWASLACEKRRYSTRLPTLNKPFSCSARYADAGGPAIAGGKAGTVCPRLPWGGKKCFPGGASENGPRFHRHQGTGRLFPAVFRKNVTAGAPFFYHAPFCCQVKMGRGSSGRRSGPPHRSASRQVRSGFLIFTKPAEKRRALSVICSPGCQLSGWQGWRLCPALRARTDTRRAGGLRPDTLYGTPRAYGHTHTL